MQKVKKQASRATSQR